MTRLVYTAVMLRVVRERLAIGLIMLLPFHALFVTVFTKMIAGPGHAPLSYLAVWKEVFLAILLLLAFLELWPKIRSSEDADSPWTLDAIDWCILLGLVLAVVTSYVVGGQSTSFQNLLHGQLSLTDKRFLLGFKYDFLPLVMFAVLRRLPWSEAWMHHALLALLAVGAVVGVYGLVTLKLPMSYFLSLGYSDQTSLYFASGPLAAFQQVEGSLVRRAQSTFSGPNQFGLWLLIPFGAALWSFGNIVRGWLEARRIGFSACFVLLLFLTACIKLGILVSLSRTAWIAAGAMTIVFLVYLFFRSLRAGRRRIFMATVLVLTTVAVAGTGFAAVKMMPGLLVRLQSGAGHLEKPRQAIKLINEHPFGMGLGTAGPASNALSDTCVFLPLGSDYAWAKPRKDICLFLGGVRKLPPGKVCECPLLTENWYLQLGVEMGVLGLVFSVVLMLLVIASGRHLPSRSPRIWVLLAFVGLSVAGLFLHAFEDSAVAYTIWLLLAAAVPARSVLPAKP